MSFFFENNLQQLIVIHTKTFPYSIPLCTVDGGSLAWKYSSLDDGLATNDFLNERQFVNKLVHTDKQTQKQHSNR